MVWFIFALLLFVIGVILFVTFYFQGENLAKYDSQDISATFYRPTPSYKYPAALALLDDVQAQTERWPFRKYISSLRASLDRMGDFDTISTISTISTITQSEEERVKGEWVIAPGADINKRLLYIHGGGFIVGSAKSHRIVTDRLSRELGVAVFALDYRLMPEVTRKQGIEDCRKAYLWLLEHNVSGLASADKIYLAGDSAGGNLALSLLAWIKEKQLRQVDAAIMFSPATDMTFSYDSLGYNAKTDFLLSPVIGKFYKIPRPVLLLMTFAVLRYNPRNPDISPVFGNLSGLPPILIHASDSEMLADDIRRYKNKAIAAGSDVRLQTWSNMLHVWHLFDLDEADEAYAEVKTFIDEINSKNGDTYKPRKFGLYT